MTRFLTCYILIASQLQLCGSYKVAGAPPFLTTYLAFQLEGIEIMSNPIASPTDSPGTEKPLSVHQHEHQPPPKNKLEDLHKLNSKLAHPLSGIPHEELMEMGAVYARENDMEDLQEEFRKGALLAQDPEAFDTLPLLTDDDKYYLRREVTHKWSHPKALYHMVVMCSMAAAVQGMGT